MYERGRAESDIKRKYGEEGWDAALEVYKKAVAETKDAEDLSGLAFLAADFAHTEALRLLFEAGVPPTVTDKYSHTLLHYLARWQESRYVPKPPGAVAEAVSFLLDSKVSALRKDENRGMLCYHYAAENGMAEFVEAMAGKGVKLTMEDKEGLNGIQIACGGGAGLKSAVLEIGYKERDLENSQKDYDKRVGRMREQGMSEADIAADIKKWMPNTPEKAAKALEAARQHLEDYLRTVKAFAEAGVEVDERAVNMAVENGAKKVAAYLQGVKDGAPAGDTGGIDAAAGGMTLHQAAERDDAEAIRAIAATGADLNAMKDEEGYKLGGRTPLAVACSFLNVGALDALLSCGADPSFRDSGGMTAAAYIGSKATANFPLFEEKRIPKTVKSLAAAGMDVNMVVDDKGNTLLLLWCGAPRGSVHNRDSIKKSMLGEIMGRNPDINAANLSGRTALMLACADDFYTMENIQMTLLEQGADVAAADRNGDTALHHAARNDDAHGAKALSEMLLEFGADPKAVNNEERTALDIATERDNLPLVKLLLSKM
ncbi:MAG: ankyrin repeat domain-containing protein [Methanomassiliicoccaceae archaeon]|nr:ankyrin repeat domain-containing protein [Methanomassiliicoccaceae archaeon]